MRSPSDRIRGYLTIAVLIGLLVFGGRQLGLLFSNSEMPLLHDYMEYWAAGKLNLEGENPYDPQRIREVQQEAGLQVDMAIMMWNPPWTLSVVMPFGLLPARIGQMVWILVQFVLVLFCSDRLWLRFGGSPSQRWIGWLLGVSFAPTGFLIGTGQIAGFCLLGLTGFLVFEKKRPLLAGMFAALTAIKPHLLSLFALVLILQALTSCKGRRVFLGGLIVGVLAALLPLLSNPEVYSQYLEALHAPSSANHKALGVWEHPTLGSWLRKFTQGPFWVQLLPCLFAMVGMTMVTLRRGKSWDWGHELPEVVLFSLLAAPYGAWPFDLVLLLVPLIYLAIRIIESQQRKRILAFVLVWLVMNGVMYLKLFAGVSTPYYVWVTPVWVGVFFACNRRRIGEPTLSGVGVCIQPDA